MQKLSISAHPKSLAPATRNSSGSPSAHRLRSNYRTSASNSRRHYSAHRQPAAPSVKRHNPRQHPDKAELAAAAPTDRDPTGQAEAHGNDHTPSVSKHSDRRTHHRRRPRDAQAKCGGQDKVTAERNGISHRDSTHAPNGARFKLGSAHYRAPKIVVSLEDKAIKHS